MRRHDALFCLLLIGILIGDSTVQVAAHTPQPTTATRIQDSCTLTFFANPVSGNISIDGIVMNNAQSGSYACGDHSLLANEPQGYIFSYWQVTGALSSSQLYSRETTIAVLGSGTITARFLPVLNETQYVGRFFVFDWKVLSQFSTGSLFHVTVDDKVTTVDANQVLDSTPDIDAESILWTHLGGGGGGIQDNYAEVNGTWQHNGGGPDDTLCDCGTDDDAVFHPSVTSYHDVFLGSYPIQYSLSALNDYYYWTYWYFTPIFYKMYYSEGTPQYVMSLNLYPVTFHTTNPSARIVITPMGLDDTDELNKLKFSDGQVGNLHGLFPISAIDTSGATFLGWETSGGVTVANAADESTNLFVTGPGTVTATFGRPVPPYIVGSAVTQLNGQITGVLNITSPILTSVTSRLVLLDPGGITVYDNFRGIGGPANNKLSTLTPNAITIITFAIPNNDPAQGYYAYDFSVWSSNGASKYADSGWNPVPLNIVTSQSYDLGSLAPQSSASVNPNIQLLRSQQISVAFSLSQATIDLTVKLQGTSQSRFTVSLTVGQFSSTAQLRLDSPLTSNMEVHNLIPGSYSLLISALSDSASLASVEVDTGSAITSPTVRIVSATSTQSSASPGGQVTYQLNVQWQILTVDSLKVTATINGNAVGSSSSLPLVPLSDDEVPSLSIDVTAPSSTSTYSIQFLASLGSGPTATAQTSMTVRATSYAITVVNSVVFCQSASFWSSIWGGKERCSNDKANPLNPSSLQALQVTGIQITNVETDQSGNPTKATVSFVATNKAGQGFHFGDGPHYDLSVIPANGLPVTLRLLLAGDSESIKVTLPVYAGELQFTIRYTLSLNAEIMLMAADLVQAVASFYLSGVPGTVIASATDIAKLGILYYWKITTEAHDGYLVSSDFDGLLDTLVQGGLSLDRVAGDLAKIKETTSDPLISIVSLISDYHSGGTIDGFTFLDVLVRLFILVLQREAPNLATDIEQGFSDAFQRYGVSIASEAPSSLTDKFLGSFGALLSIVELAKVLYDVLTSPPAERKIIDSHVQQGTGESFDPTVTVQFSGPSSLTNLTYFGDVRSTSATANGNSAEISYNVAPELQSLLYLSLSDPTVRYNLLRSIGFNSTQTTLAWKNSTSSFTIDGTGSLDSYLNSFNFAVDSSRIHGTQQTSVDAVRIGPQEYLLNLSLTYPFGKNLTYTINVNLPGGAQLIDVLSQGNFTLSGQTITWNQPINSILVKFTIASNVVTNLPIQLETGWNLVSLPLVPDRSSISSILSAQLAKSEIVSVWSYVSASRNWQVFTPGKPSTLTTMVDGNAYWIYMRSPDTLYINGSIIPPAQTPPSYSLVQGWNLVGFKPQPILANETVGTYLTSITGKYDTSNVWILDNVSGNWIRATDSTWIRPGEAMWILMTTPEALRP